MTATDPSLVTSVDTTGWDQVDVSELKDMTTCCTDDNTTAACNVGSVAKVGKSPDDALRIELPNLTTITNVDTVTCEITAVHNISGFALLPYNGATSVDVTNKITATGSTGTKVFTLTTAFIGDLFDQGSGTWACRLTEDNGISGDYQIAETDADLTVGVADANRRFNVINQSAMI